MVLNKIKCLDFCEAHGRVSGKGKVGQDQDLDTYSRECVPFTRYSGGNVVIVGSVVKSDGGQGSQL